MARLPSVKHLNDQVDDTQETIDPLRLSERFFESSNEIIAGSIGASSGLLISILAYASHPALAIGMTSGPLAIILGGIATLVTRRLTPKDKRDEDELYRRNEHRRRSSLRFDIDLFHQVQANFPVRQRERLASDLVDKVAQRPVSTNTSRLPPPGMGDQVLPASSLQPSDSEITEHRN